MVGETVEQFRLRIGGRTLKLPAGTLDVGRMSDCWLTLDDDLISRYHARFHVGPGTLDLEDLGSRNGTYINGKRLSGRAPLGDGDQVRIGREMIAVLGPRAVEREESDEDPLRRTIGPGEETQFPSLIGQLVEKSLSMGKLKEAERYALALTNQLMGAKVPGDHPTAVSCVRCLVSLAERSSSGVWLDRVFRLHAVHGWVMSSEVLDRIRGALDTIPRVPGTGLEDYEHTLRALVKEGQVVPPALMATVAELADAYGNG
jgi:hypothetical protein